MATGETPVHLMQNALGEIQIHTKWIEGEVQAFKVLLHRSKNKDGVKLSVEYLIDRAEMVLHAARSLRKTAIPAMEELGKI